MNGINETYSSEQFQGPKTNECPTSADYGSDELDFGVEAYDLLRPSATTSPSMHCFSLAVQFADGIW